MRSQTQKQLPIPWWTQSIVYWQANQVAITFHSPLERTAGIDRIIASLRLPMLNQFLAARGFQLQSFTTKDIPHPDEPSWNELEQLEVEVEQLEAEVEALERIVHRRASQTLLLANDVQSYKTPVERDLEEIETRIEVLEREIERRERVIHQQGNETSGNDGDGKEPPRRDLNSTIGKYLFVPASGRGTLVICFFHSSNPSLLPSSSMHGHSKEGSPVIDNTQTVVKLINQNLERLKQDGDIPIVAASPNWISGGAPGIGIACPASVPIPLPKDRTYMRWHFELPELSETLQNLKGDGTTIYVLDATPTTKHIEQVASHIGNKNALLQSLAVAMNGTSPAIEIQYQSIPARLNSVRTGKDIYGRHFGFKMPDHGLFITGILHDLVPNAKIRCIRVLNDACVGDLGMIVDALNTIQQHMVSEKITQAVINLSMVIVPSSANLPDIWFSEGNKRTDGLATMIQELDPFTIGFHMVVHSLVAQGAVVVAAAGNDSDASNYRGTSEGIAHRSGPRYPAAFPEVISVGSVDKQGQATSYSDYPALPPHYNGVATYGGALPHPVVPPETPNEPEPAGAKTWANVDDAVVGLYSSAHYPMLSATDEPPEGYNAPEYSHGWAYWSGTSFATPIVSALAARLLQAKHNGNLSTSMSVKDLITTASGQKLLTTSHNSFSNNTGFGVAIGLLKAVQTGS